MLSDLPRPSFTLQPPAAEGASNTVIEAKTLGWNAKLAVDYLMPLGNSGLKLATQAGFSQSKIKVVTKGVSTDPNITIDSLPVRVSNSWRDPFLGVGLRIPTQFMSSQMEVSIMFAHIFTDEKSVDQSMSAQLIYNFR